MEEMKHQTMQQLSSKSQQENNIVEQLKAIVTEKEAKVRQLEHEVEGIKLAVGASELNQIWIELHWIKDIHGKLQVTQQCRNRK